MKQLLSKLSKSKFHLILGISLLFILSNISCEKNRFLEACETFDDHQKFRFDGALIYSKDTSGNDFIIVSPREEFVLPISGNLNLTNNKTRYNITSSFIFKKDYSDTIKLDLEESGKLFYEEDEPYNLKNVGYSKEVKSQFIPDVGEPSTPTTFTIHCENTVLVYDKRINEKDSIQLIFVDEN